MVASASCSLTRYSGGGVGVEVDVDLDNVAAVDVLGVPGGELSSSESALPNLSRLPTMMSSSLFLEQGKAVLVIGRRRAEDIGSWLSRGGPGSPRQWHTDAASWSCLQTWANFRK